jgi:hypothetical protein
MSATGQGTALSVGRARIIAVVDGVEGTLDVDVADPPIPKVVVVPAPALAPELSATGIMASIAPPVARPPVQRESAKTPVVAPAIPARAEAPRPAPTTRNNRGVVYAAVGATVIIIVAVAAFATVSNRSPTSQSSDSPTVQPAAASQPVASTSQAAPVVTASPPETASVKPSTTATAAKKTPAAKPPATKTVEKAPASAAPVPDAFAITVLSSPPPMRIGDRTTLRATVDHVSGSGPMPRLDWQSSRPGVVSVDAGGNITAIAEGQATVSAAAGGARADVTVTVLAPAPVVAPPPAQRPAEPPPKPAGPSAEEIRAKGVDALRESANAMAAAIKSKDVATATRLFGDARTGDAQDLLGQLPRLFDLRVTAQIGQPQFTDRAGSVDYTLKIDWTSQAGPGRTRMVSFRAEAERAGDAWTITRHRLVGGWR